VRELPSSLFVLKFLACPILAVQVTLKSTTSFNRSAQRTRNTDGLSAGTTISAKYNPSDLNLPVVLDMTAVTWQTRRTPRGGKKYENRDVHGTGTVYMDEAFARKAYSGVLKVTAKITKKPPAARFTLGAVRVASLLVTRPVKPTEFHPASISGSYQIPLFVQGALNPFYAHCTSILRPFVVHFTSYPV
jgi:hypothetical protein